MKNLHIHCSPRRKIGSSFSFPLAGSPAEEPTQPIHLATTPSRKPIPPSLQLTATATAIHHYFSLSSKVPSGGGGRARRVGCSRGAQSAMSFMEDAEAEAAESAEEAAENIANPVSNGVHSKMPTVQRLLPCPGLHQQDRSRPLRRLLHTLPHLRHLPLLLQGASVSRAVPWSSYFPAPFPPRSP